MWNCRDCTGVLIVCVCCWIKSNFEKHTSSIYCSFPKHPANHLVKPRPKHNNCHNHHIHTSDSLYHPPSDITILFTINSITHKCYGPIWLKTKVYQMKNYYSLTQDCVQIDCVKHQERRSSKFQAVLCIASVETVECQWSSHIVGAPQYVHELDH